MFGNAGMGRDGAGVVGWVGEGVGWGPPAKKI